MGTESSRGCSELPVRSFLDGGVTHCPPRDKDISDSGQSQEVRGFVSQLSTPPYDAGMGLLTPQSFGTRELGLRRSDLQILADNRPLTLDDFSPNSRLLAIFRPEDLPDIFNFLWRSPYPQPTTPLNELRMTIRILYAILTNWEALKAKKVFFQKLDRSSDCSMPNALLAYQPFTTRAVHQVVNNQFVLDQWGPRIASQVAVPGRPGAYEATVISNPLPYSLTYTIQVKTDSLGNVLGGSFDRLPYDFGLGALLPGRRFSELHGKFYLLPTSEGSTVLVRRSYADVSLVPDQLFCKIGKAGLIQSMSALACKVAYPEWTIERGDRSATDYTDTVQCKPLKGFGTLDYSFGGDLEWITSPIQK